MSSSFNPCFCGTRARTLLRRPRPKPCICCSAFRFNPCFCGTRARTRRSKRSGSRSTSFNPCFCGTRARTSKFCLDDANCPSFNPCFCGTRARTSFRHTFLYDGWVLFQSLFLWNSRPDSVDVRWTARSSGCFNPCFCGTRARTEITEGHYQRPEVFQSLFLWNSRPDILCHPFPSYGNSVSILVFVELAPGRLELPAAGWFASKFQSLFLWNSRPDNIAKELGVSLKEAFQSLFLWNSRPDGEIMMVMHWWRDRFNPCFCGTRARTERRCMSSAPPPGFNPCFCGTRARTISMISCSKFRGIVSILVFVELAPGRCLGRRARNRRLCFNPCFCGTRARTINGPDKTRASNSFNPCFCGTRARTFLINLDIDLDTRFQSLFLWNSRPDRARRQELVPSGVPVSIIVFVELAPGPYIGRGAVGRRDVSILVFVELAPGRRPG